ncbi:hypothetical protein JTB14_015116 [Gonioctena quinquepunctata]|nr:hypothetical protein JTB14_015116 [Gonioctena quinquepunctata]
MFTRELRNHGLPYEMDWVPGERLHAIQEVTQEELTPSCDILSPEKPRPSGIAVETVKIATKTIPIALLTVVRQILRAQQFPEEWKKAIVILIPKQGNKFRTICLLEMNGTWEGYKKVNVPLNLSCLTFNIVSLKKIDSCDVQVVRTNPREPGVMNTFPIRKNKDGSFYWDEYSFNISLDTSGKFAVLWIDDYELPQNDNIFVMLKDTKKPDDETDEEINKLLETWDIEEGTLKKINHSPCGSGYLMEVPSISILLLAIFQFFIFLDTHIVKQENYIIYSGKKKQNNRRVSIII